MPTTTNGTLNLEYYRKQARALLKSAKSGDAPALERISQHLLPTKRHDLNAQSVALNDSQRAIAREQGFPNWNRFRAFVQASSSDALTLSVLFVSAALNDLAEAERILAEHPEVASSGLIAALLLGDAVRVKSLLKLTPDSLQEPVGLQSWAPLLYVCFSRFASRASARRSEITDLGRLLLQHAADPNGHYMPEQWPDNPLPCLYGASGLNNNPELTAALIDAGAILDDAESLYHSTEHADLECMRLLLDRGANPNSPNVIFHILDREAPDAMRLLFDAGADVNAIYEARNQTTLHWAVWRARGVETVRELIKRGVDINAVQFDGRTAYAMAFLSGQTAVANLLAANGANTTLRPLDKWIGVCATATEPELTFMLQTVPWIRDHPEIASKMTDIAADSEDDSLRSIRERMSEALPDLLSAPEAGRMLADLAMSHHTGAVRALLSAGVDVDARGDSGATALHWACWHGYSDTVKVLLDAGASLTIEDEEFHGTPPGWFGHGIHNCPDRSGDWLGVARELVAVSAVIPKANIPTGNSEVDALLKEHGYLTD